MWYPVHVLYTESCSSVQGYVQVPRGLGTTPPPASRATLQGATRRSLSQKNTRGKPMDSSDSESSVCEVTTPPQKPPKHDRKTGQPFERHRAASINAILNRSTGTGGVGSEGVSLVRSVLGGKRVFSHWADVPASVLVAVGWEPRDEAERRRIYEGPAERRGFREYGGDWAVADDAHDPTYIAIGQDKDHKRLSLGVLGRFDRVGRKAHRFNVQHGHSHGTTSAFLCFPIESRISRRDNVELTEMKTEFGLHLLAFDGFSATLDSDPNDIDTMEMDEPTVQLGETGSVLPAAPVVVQPAVNASSSDELQFSFESVCSSAVPTGSKPRPFQTKAAKKIVDKPALYLVQAPPGCGKTEVTTAVIGTLIRKQHDTRASKQLPFVGFVVAPYIDHATQFYNRVSKVMLAQFGIGWRKLVELVADDSVPDISVLKRKFENGTRLFISTDASASLLLKLAEHVKEARTSRLLVVKDEAHYNSTKSSASTKLLHLVDSKSGDYGIACTATPDGDVMVLPELETGLEYTLEKAIKEGFCAPYRITFPLIADLETGLPVEAQQLASEDQIGIAALFVVGGMMHDGARRCIAYAADVAESKVAKGFLERACAFHGVGCVATVVVGDQHVCKTKDRESIYKAFQHDAVHEPARVDGEDGFKIILRFLVSVAILDQCVDLPKCDSTAILSPPTTAQDAKTAHRAIQRFGRAGRPGDGKVACHYVFTSLENPWIEKLFSVLNEHDPGYEKRIAVRGVNPVTSYTREATERAHTDIADLTARFGVGSKKGWKPSIEERIRILAHYFPDGPPAAAKTITVDEASLRPDGVDAFVDNVGNLWANFKNRFDTYSREYVKLMYETVKWAEAEMEKFRAKKEAKPAYKPSIEERIRILAHYSPAAPPPISKKVTVDDASLRPDGVDAFVDNVGNFWDKFKHRFDTYRPEQVKLLYETVKWAEAEMEKFRAKKEAKPAYKPSIDERIRILAHYFPDAPPTASKMVTVGEASLRPDGVDAFLDATGRFWDSFKECFDKRSPEHIKLLYETVKWAEEEMEKFRAKKKAKKEEEDTSEESVTEGSASTAPVLGSASKRSAPTASAPGKRPAKRGKTILV